jgi:hypothetical protein
MTGRVPLIALMAAASPTTMPAQLQTPIVASPNGHPALRISMGSERQLTWAATLSGKPLIEADRRRHANDSSSLPICATRCYLENLTTKPPAARIREPLTHKIVNTGKTPIHHLIVELKEPSK